MTLEYITSARDTHVVNLTPRIDQETVLLRVLLIIPIYLLYHLHIGQEIIRPFYCVVEHVNPYDESMVLQIQKCLLTLTLPSYFVLLRRRLHCWFNHLLPTIKLFF